MIDPRLKEAGDALAQIFQSGDEAAVAEVAKRYLQGDLDNVRAEATLAAKLAHEAAQARDWFKAEYSDIVEDPALLALAQKLEREELQKNPNDSDPFARFGRVGDKVRKIHYGDQEEADKEAWEQVTKGRRISNLHSEDEVSDDTFEAENSSIIAEEAKRRRKLQGHED